MTEVAGRPGGHPLPSRPIRIASAQAQAQAGDIEANTATVAEMIREAARAKARLVVFPEKFLSGYEPDLIHADPRRYAVQPDDPRLKPIADACRETGTAAIVGAAFHDQDDLYVSALVIGANGELVTRYDKQQLFQSEREIYREGAAGCTLEIDGWRLGLGICYDSGFPEHARAAALDGCHAYVVSALFSVGNGYHESRTWFPARALDNTCYAVLSNHIGTTGGWNACGSSAIWGPDGRLLAEAGPDRPELITADLDPQVLLAARDSEPLLRDLRDTTTHPRTRFQLT
ncbi:carbon-nitrogen hydrolase family protein [Bailinhaonella thermotolerans]|uniref:Carbon-nitrogen hydrolase family protein n=1 Tax=Bailinhaonella thermotolerans TaxID=1070861 RepID=A0A3A4B4V0_9ACTN|nr:carbon-nitrogen hydrolase family protein [Bailinhaonella thermotolerans]RJL35610.1 carbon-nitrogen hydrolase family protein [Bailinhaonella thermotolerans]